MTPLSFNPDLPVAAQPGLWSIIAAQDRLLRPEDSKAVELADEEKRAAPINQHTLWVGPQAALHEAADKIIGDVVRICQFQESRDPLQPENPLGLLRLYLQEQFTSFFPHDQQAAGWVSLTSCRRTFTKRLLPDRTVLAVERRPEPRFARKQTQLAFAPLVLLGGIEVPTDHLCLAYRSESEKPKTQVALVKVPRRLKSPERGVDADYNEHRVSLALQGDDDYVLKQARIPALIESGYDDPSLRLAPILSLHALNRSLLLSVLGIELHPESGRVASLRANRFDLATDLASNPFEDARLGDAFSLLD
jgi:hypothetical protein